MTSTDSSPAENSDSVDKPTSRPGSALSDDDRKRFFRPPVGDPNVGGPLPPVTPPPVTRPVDLPAPRDEIPHRKSFDEIIAGEIHRMTDAIPIIGRNRKGEPRRVIVVFGIVVAIAVVVGGVVFLVVNSLS